MLLLQFQIDNEIYAIDIHSIIEIAPLVNLKAVPQSNELIAGVFNYKGILIPVVNLSLLIKGKKIKQLLSTRIIIVNYKSKEFGDKIIGLLAENVTETINCDESDLQPQNIKVEKAPYFSDMLVRGEQIIQLININKLISFEIQQYLFKSDDN